MPARTSHDRRAFLKRTGAAGGAVALGGLAGCLGDLTGGSDEPTEDDPLTVAVYGGIFKDVMDEVLFPQFEEETGIPVESKSAETSEFAVPQLESAAQAGKAPVDVSIIAQTGVLQGTRSDIWHKWDGSRFDNIQYVSDNLLNYNEDDELVGVGALSWYINLVHNSEEISKAPTSWTALWDSTYENQMGLLGLASNSFLLEITAETHFDGKEMLQDRDGIKKCLDKLEGIKPQAQFWYENEAEFQQRLRDGEVPAGMLYNDITLVMKGNGAPVESHFVEEGSVLDSGSWCTLKTTPFVDAAASFIDYASRPAVQDRVAENLFTSPTVKREHSELSDEDYERIAGPGPSEAITPEYQIYLDEEEWINEQWNEFITSD